MKNLDKKYIVISIVFLLLTTWACRKDYEPPMAENSHLFVTSSSNGTDVITIINDTVSLIDLSKGVAWRTWYFEEGTADVINSDNDLTSNDQNCKVAFLVPGLYEIPLYQLYKENVWIGQEQTNSKEYDTIITVLVHDSVHASFEMERVRDSVIFDDLVLADNALNEIWAGRRIRFMNRSTGGATADWIIQRSDIEFTYINSGPDTLEYKFTSMGPYNVGLYAHNDVTSDNDLNGYLDLIEAVPSFDPVTLDSCKIVDPGDTEVDKIKLVFSRDMDTVPSGTLISNLTLEVYDRINIEYPNVITDAYRDPDLYNIIWLELEEEVYNTDSIILSYAPGLDSVLISADNMTMKPFENRQATFTYINYFETIRTDFDWNFENLNSNWSIAWEGIWAQGSMNMVEDFSDPSTPGDNSMRVVMDSTQNGSFVQTIEANNGAADNRILFPLPAGEYRLMMWVYVEDLGNPTSGDGVANVRLYMNGGDSGDDEKIMCQFDPNFPVGEWVVREAIFPNNGNPDYYSAPGGNNQVLIRLFNQNNTEDLVFYIDRIEAHIMEIR